MADKPLSTGALAIDPRADATHLFPEAEGVRYIRARASNGKLVYLRLNKMELDYTINAALCQQMNDFLDSSSADPLPVVIEASGYWQGMKMIDDSTAVVMRLASATLIKDSAKRAPFFLRPHAKLAAAA
jgi:hypothetical protein